LVSSAYRVAEPFHRRPDTGCGPARRLIEYERVLADEHFVTMLQDVA
jgi:hypothetical protein